MNFDNPLDFGYGRFLTEPHQTPTILEIRHHIIRTLISEYGLKVEISPSFPDEEPCEHPIYDTFLLGSQVGWIISNDESVTLEDSLSPSNLETLSEVIETVFDYKVICIYTAPNRLTTYLYEGAGS